MDCKIYSGENFVFIAGFHVIEFELGERCLIKSGLFHFSNVKSIYVWINIRFICKRSFVKLV